jgi:uncharacterized phiE125 gp8 family phage protein
MPIQSITSIEYESTFGVWADVSESYYFDAVTGTVKPETYWDSNRLRVTYVSGYGDDHKSVPENIRQGLFRLVANLYDNRSDISSFGGQGSLPFDAASFLNQERVFRI